jgi:phosphopantothenoylcysteine decarboxylase / phosphopantothenate---cysteine ligase
MKKIILGVTGGIAAYKAAELARLFVRGGAEVQVVMTPAATEFITPLTFQTLTGRPAYVEMYTERTGDQKIRHIDLLDQADLIVIAPATANTIAKIAGGLADNLLTTLYLAATCPVVVVPSMNINMYAHRAVQNNLTRLGEHGCLIMDPDAGELACGVYGKGRMPEPEDIYKFARASLLTKDFKGVKAIVTAGPTREPLDPVRYLSNPSTGLMGYAIAEALSERGGEVTLISGPTHLLPPAGVKTVAITTADEMYKAVTEGYKDVNLVIKAAAVSDFRPSESFKHKVKKEDAVQTLQLERNRDILQELGSQKKDCILIGFAAETEEAIQNAHQKLLKKNLDLIIVNDVSEPGAGFAVKTNRVSIIDHEGNIEKIPLMDKYKLSHEILNRIAKLFQK